MSATLKQGPQLLNGQRRLPASMHHAMTVGAQNHHLGLRVHGALALKAGNRNEMVNLNEALPMFTVGLCEVESAGGARVAVNEHRGGPKIGIAFVEGSQSSRAVSFKELVL